MCESLNYLLSLEERERKWERTTYIKWKLHDWLPPSLLSLERTPARQFPFLLSPALTLNKDLYWDFALLHYSSSVLRILFFFLVVKCCDVLNMNLLHSRPWTFIKTKLQKWLIQMILMFMMSHELINILPPTYAYNNLCQSKHNLHTSSLKGAVAETASLARLHTPFTPMHVSAADLKHKH